VGSCFSGVRDSLQIFEGIVVSEKFRIHGKLISRPPDGIGARTALCCMRFLLIAAGRRDITIQSVSDLGTGHPIYAQC
jgi:hypothetical protein